MDRKVDGCEAFVENNFEEFQCSFFFNHASHNVLHNVWDQRDTRCTIYQDCSVIMKYELETQHIFGYIDVDVCTI